MSPELIKEFLIDCYENLDRLDAELVALEQDPHDATRLASAFRTVHTIKGAAGFLAFKKLESITHVGENLMTKVRDGRLLLNQEITSGLLQMIDAVRHIATHIEQHDVEPDTEYPDLLLVLENLAEGGSTPRPAPAVTLPPAPVAPAAPAPAAVPTPDPVPATAQDPKPEPQDDRRTGDDRRAGDDRRSGPVSDTALRVDVDLLDKLMNLVGELVLARNQILQSSVAHADQGLTSATQRLDLVTSELQEGVMKTRMQPIGNIWSKFPRVVRDVATECGKQVRIEMEGKDTDLDKTIIEAIKDPLTHIVRNAVDHGIEAPGVRIQKGKPAEGVLRLRAFHEGGQINIEISDDGAGIDTDRVRATAVRRGLVTAEQAARLTDQEAIRLIFEPGFSTAEKVTNISGRGVGMDVVKTNIEKIGGQVDLQSRFGEGTLLKIKIPLTLAIIPALIITGTDGARYAIPQVNLLELVRLDGDTAATSIERIKDALFYRLRGNLLPLVYLHRELGLDAAPNDEAVNIVVLKADDRQFGLVVDRINDTEEIVVKPLGKQLKGVAVFAGATIMGDGTVALILDVLGLAQRASVLSQVRARGLTEGPREVDATGQEKQTLLLFRAGEYERLAIPLSQVARLEEFSPEMVERTGAGQVVQYRDEILPLIHVWGNERHDANAPRQAIVFNHEDSHVGVLVDEIIDIVSETVVLQSRLARRGVLGSAVIQQKVTDLVDVDQVLEAAKSRMSGRAA